MSSRERRFPPSASGAGKLLKFETRFALDLVVPPKPGENQRLRNRGLEWNLGENAARRIRKRCPRSDSHRDHEPPWRRRWASARRAFETERDMASVRELRRSDVVRSFGSGDRRWRCGGAAERLERVRCGRKRRVGLSWPVRASRSRTRNSPCGKLRILGTQRGRVSSTRRGVGEDGERVQHGLAIFARQGIDVRRLATGDCRLRRDSSGHGESDEHSREP